MLKIKATILKFLYNKDDYKIMVCGLTEPNENIMLNDRGNFTVVGNANLVTEGKSYDMNVEPVRHPKYGMQYKLVSLPQFNNLTIDSLTPEQELDILINITTPKQAHNINTAYPDFVRLILRNEDEKIDLKKIYNVGEVYFQVYKERIRKEFSFLLVTTAFPEYELSRDEVKILNRMCNNDLEKVKALIQDNPYYCFCVYNHRNFLTTDKMLKLHRPDLIDSEQRCLCLVYWIVKDNESYGNTRMDARDMALIVQEHAPELLSKLREFVEKNTLIHYDEETNTVANSDTYSAESFTAHTIKRLLKSPIKWDIDWKQYKNTNGFELTDEQLELLHLVCDNNIAILQGKSGTGKTSATQALITMLEDNDLTYTLIAPTGIAAKVLSETTGRKAGTIHRTIGTSGSIDTDVLILDEISMCGISHMSMVCPALSEYTKLVMIGDDAQLASIACGNVIKDIQQWGKVPTANLTKVFRYGKGDIDTVATDTRNEKQFLSDDGKLLFKSNNQYKFIQANDNPLQQVIEQYRKLLSSGYSQDDILILTPYNVGAYGTYAINREIQSEFNTNTDNVCVPTKGIKNNNIELQFLKNDRVLNTQNHYDVEVYHDFDTGDEIINTTTNIFNGDIGVVREAHEDYIIVEIDENLIKMSKSQANELLLGNAVTIHKIQGGAAKAIILLTTNHHKRMLSNNLLYVALTRAREQIIHIGDVEAVNRCLHIHETESRNTWLYDMLGGDSD